MNKHLFLGHALYLGRKWAGVSAPRNLIIQLGPWMASSEDGAILEESNNHRELEWGHCYAYPNPTTGCTQTPSVSFSGSSNVAQHGLVPGLSGLELCLLSTHCLTQTFAATSASGEPAGSVPSASPFSLVSSPSHPWVIGTSFLPPEVLGFSTSCLHQQGVSNLPHAAKGWGERKGGFWTWGGEREEGDENMSCYLKKQLYWNMVIQILKKKIHAKPVAICRLKNKYMVIHVLFH